MNKILLLVTAILANLTIAFGQTRNGIHFEKGLNYAQILAKAKAEHKPIFVDCYATWCAPCKWMDANVYTNKQVGEVYNSRFVCVKVQMDKTAKDDSLTRFWYGTAGDFARKLNVNAYPTFLFISPENTPLHKVSGSLDVKAFLQMAEDAQDPGKQYFTIIKNFRPGKLDTAEEKHLAWLFYNSDKDLAGKMAFDYLSRVPQSTLTNSENGGLMIGFQNNPRVLDMAIHYVLHYGLNHNRAFVEQFTRQPAMMRLAADSIKMFSNAETGKAVNLRFIVALGNDTAIRKFAINYIDHLPEDSLYVRKNIDFIGAFTKTPSDRGFDLFYHHAERVNQVMGRGDYAENNVVYVVNKTDVKPIIKASIATGIPPNFDSLKAILSQKYDAVTAEKAIVNAMVSWNNHLVYDKKQSQYWPDLIKARIAQINAFRQDTVKGGMQIHSVNSTAYDIFLRSDDREQLNVAINWMKTVVKDNPAQAGCADTYAGLLYKTEQINDALEWETKALRIAKTNHDNDNAKFFANGIEKMKRGEKIWLEKEYIDN